MRGPLHLLVLASLCLPMTGCGSCGGLEADMRRAAKRDSPDTDPEDAPGASVAATAKAAPATTKAAAPEETAPVAPAVEPTAPMVSNEKPKEELTVTDRRARSIANLEKISKALTAYVKKKGKLPPASIAVDGEGQLSWRVIILPELGYPELKARFRDEPWDTAYNKALLDYIPPEYQSPERFDAKTNYLAVVGSRSAFFSSVGVAPGLIKDGPDNTLAVVEVDDQFAVEWTKPSDHLPQLETPADRLNGLRGEGAFGIMASGRVVLLPREMQASRLAALFTAIGGEPIGSTADLKPPTAEPPPVTIAAVADDPNAANAAAASAEGSAPTEAGPTPIAPAQPMGFPGSVPYVADVGKQEVPDEESLARARESLKELYGKDFQQAKTLQQRQKFVKDLLAEAPNVEQNASDYHELVRIARDMAAAVGDTDSALQASQLLEQRFQIDPLAARLAVLEALAKHGSELKTAEPACQESLRLLDEAFEGDRYDVALPLCDVALGFARNLGNRADVARLTQRIPALEDARSLYIAATKALDKVQADPADAAANEAVGRYLCLVKNRWEAGLPFLNKSADIRLRGIGSIELSPNRTAHETLALAEQYWELAGRFKQPQRRGLHLRAVYCYASVAPRLATSLDKVKVAKRLDEAIAIYGREEIDRVIAPLKPKAPAVTQSES
ncbi:MAG: DUF1559 domain-containing protein [Planctomycetaceae bacterium]|nr:DUF1559 domain-containing protein [Planctomycetaceae bacterium]